MITNTFVFNMGLIMNTPPPFDGEWFESWKARFEICIKITYFEMWDILINGQFIPTFSFNDDIVNKSGFRWTKEEGKTQT